MNATIRHWAPALASGLLLGIAFPTYHVFPLAWVGLVPVLAATAGGGPRHAALHFFAAGLVFYLVVLQWLMANVYWAGGWAFWGYVLLSAYMASFWGLLGAIWSRARTRLPWMFQTPAFACLWATMEHLQGTLFGGFGWGALGYSQGPDLAFAQWAAIGGVTLVSAVLAGVNAAFAQAFVQPAKRLVPVAAAVATILAVHGVGSRLLAEPGAAKGPYHAGIVQTHFPQEMKWDPEYALEMIRNAGEKSRILAENRPVDLFVWPESLVMPPFDDPVVQDMLAALCADTGIPLFTGTTRLGEGTANVRNSAVLFDADGAFVDYYDKMHLAPFGEFVPFADYLPFLRQVVPSIGDIEAGAEMKVLEAGGRRFGPLICFEVLFPPMANALRREGADFLVVVTNLGWFGASNAIPQELEIARFRAIETRLPLVHSANTGISGVFDPWGRFTGLTARVDSRGTYYELDEPPPPRFTIMTRMVGSVPVPEPAAPTVPGGPVWLPWVLTVFGLGLGGWSCFRRRARTGATEAP